MLPWPFIKSHYKAGCPLSTTYNRLFAEISKAILVIWRIFMELCKKSFWINCGFGKYWMLNPCYLSTGRGIRVVSMPFPPLFPGLDADSGKDIFSIELM